MVSGAPRSTPPLISTVLAAASTATPLQTAPTLLGTFRPVSTASLGPHPESMHWAANT